MARRPARIPWILSHVLDRLDIRLGALDLQQRRRWSGGVDDDLHDLCHWCSGTFMFPPQSKEPRLIR